MLDMFYSFADAKSKKKKSWIELFLTEPIKKNDIKIKNFFERQQYL